MTLGERCHSEQWVVAEPGSSSGEVSAARRAGLGVGFLPLPLDSVSQSPGGATEEGHLPARVGPCLLATCGQGRALCETVCTAGAEPGPRLLGRGLQVRLSAHEVWAGWVLCGMESTFGMEFLCQLAPSDNP